MYFPAFLDLRNQKCVVIGGGRVAQRKIGALWQAKADLTVISPHFTDDFERWLAKRPIEVVQRCYQPGDLQGAFLAIAATDEEATNQMVAEEAQRRGVLLNVVDKPDSCTFITPATVRRGPLHLAISTSGTSPMMAKKIRQQLEEQFSPAYGRFLRLLDEVRPKVLQDIPDADRRRELFDRLTQPRVLDWIKRGRTEKAKRWMDETIREFAERQCERDE